MEAVRAWLGSVGLGQYADAFEREGYDELELMHDLSESDVDDIVQAVGMRAGHSEYDGTHPPPPLYSDNASTCVHWPRNLPTTLQLVRYLHCGIRRRAKVSQTPDGHTLGPGGDTSESWPKIR